MREVYRKLLFLGNARDARDLGFLYDHRIAAVVDLAIDEPPAQLAHDLVYCRIPLCEGSGNSDAMLEVAIRCVATLVTRRVRTLVACRAGLSRSPAIVAAALSILGEGPPDACLTAIAGDAPHDVSPALWAAVKTVCERIREG